MSESKIEEIFIVIINRLLKIIGGVIKGFSYIFHFFFPKKRFTIPKSAKPLIKSTKRTKIPKIIWQTNYTNKVTLPIYFNYLCIRVFSPTFEYRYMGTEDRDEFMKENTPKRLYESFSLLTDGAAQADVWRLFVLNHIGGVYLDIDAHLVWFAEKITKDKEEVFIRAKRGHINNYFIASKPDNDIIKTALEIVLENIEKRKIDGGVYHLTGPIVLNKAIKKVGRKINDRYYKITAIQGSFTNEYFQYIDKQGLKWNKIKNEDLLKK